MLCARRVLHLAVVPLTLGALTLGCSGSRHHAVGTSSPAATTSSGATAPVSSGQLPAAPPSAGTPLGTHNAELQAIWDNLRPMVLDQLQQNAATKLQGQRYSSSALDLELTNVRLGQQTQMQVAPGFTRLDFGGVALRAPLQGSWQVVLEADARVTVKLGGLSPALNVPLTITISDLSVEVQADLDSSDPTRPVLQRVGQPQLAFNVRLDSSNPLIQTLGGLLNGPANWLAQRASTLALGSLTGSLNGLQGLPGAVPADGAPPLADSGVATPFAEVVANVDLKIRRDNMPHGTVLVARMDTPQTDSWEDAYKNGGPGNQGQVIGYHSGGDSAIFTGMYLASQAFRYAATGDSLALDTIGHALSGIGALLDVNGGTGLLARCAAPENSPVGQDIVRRNRVFRRSMYRGEYWVTDQGDNGISRDQYSGVFFGLAIAYELVPQVRADCQRRLEQMLDYLIAHQWIVDEDRPAYNGTNAGSRGPTFWEGSTQKLAFLLSGFRMEPARYANELAQAGAIADVAWLGAWTSTFGPDHYYKFNLGHMAYYNFFRLETDPTRWQQMHRAYAITERYVGHHRNPHFDLVQTSIDPQTRGDLFPCSREVMRRFLQRNHREVAPPVVDLSGVTWVTLPTYGYNNTSTGGITVGSSTQQYPSEPLDVRLRRPTGHFLWQRDPFSPATPNQGDPRAEKEGLDLVLPYWMGRFYGAF